MVLFHARWYGQKIKLNLINHQQKFNDPCVLESRNQCQCPLLHIIACVTLSHSNTDETIHILVLVTSQLK